ncbi:DUF2799 domain-containing protein [Vibrio sp. CK2-1]|uniref:DUF2799 domain-containing protein n=1 Tax=Vibrio sp. CK2-1 TaxID=2912249 RepID=UPI001F206849|nr:DUF2799 domain-containing protein [Vibrio sp. CK2-1]MCF7355234.1 DUF2799 domain-containing protein [Vibrio sp. CK2-1]
MNQAQVKKWIKNIGVVAGLLLVVACTSTAEDYAKAGDWNAVGYSDGIKGKQHRTAGDFKDFSKVNINDYADGYLKGINEYCNPNHAYQIGLSGNYYEGVCEGTPDSQKFRMEWQRGWNDSQLNN